MNRPTDRHPGPVWPWMAFVILASLLLSRAFACAAPFAALAALAALTLRDRDAVALVSLAWLGNQAIGFGLMHYPLDASTLGWGVAIGAAAQAGWVAARVIGRAAASPPRISRIASALIGAYAAYELALFAARLVLPSGPGAFTPAVVARLFAINAIALALLLVARRLAAAAGLAASSAAPA